MKVANSKSYGNELVEQIIRPTLNSLGVHSSAAEKLLLGTVAAKSNQTLRLGNNKGIGIYSITPERHHEIWDNYIAHDEDLASLVRGFASQREFLKAPHQELIFNLRYATAIAWLGYQQAGMNVEEAHTDQELALFWHQVHARKDPKRTPADFLTSLSGLDNHTEKAA